MGNLQGFLKLLKEGRREQGEKERAEKI